MKDKRQRRFALSFALLGAIVLAPLSYFLGRALTSGDAAVTAARSAGNDTVAVDSQGAAVLAAWSGGILGIIAGGRIGSACAARLHRRDQTRARRERYAHVIEEYERNRSEEPDVNKDEEHRKARKRRKRDDFSPWP